LAALVDRQRIKPPLDRAVEKTPECSSV